MGAFVHRTVVEDEHTYAVRIDDGAMLDGHEHVQQARVHLSPESTDPLAAILGCEPANLEKELDTLAAQLGIANVHAVSLLFDDAGNYRDFDRRSFLTRRGGKELVVRDVRARSHGRAAFVGDGASDLEAKPAVDRFIGFGGVVVRSLVKENADVFVAEHDLRAVLTHLL